MPQVLCGSGVAPLASIASGPNKIFVGWPSWLILPHRPCAREWMALVTGSVNPCLLIVAQIPAMVAREIPAFRKLYECLALPSHLLVNWCRECKAPRMNRLRSKYVRQNEDDQGE